MTDSGDLMPWVIAESARNPILKTRYFRELAEGTRREIFVETQKQFFFAVRYFSRPMAALTARMPDSARRRGLVHNLAEEHGADEEHSAIMDPALAHDRTFGRFLGTLGVEAGEMGSLREGPAARAFNNALMGACVMEPVPTAFGCMGVIEHAFAGISARIGADVVRHGWVAEAELVHYKTHAEIDERHAAEFFQVVQNDWVSSPSGRAEIEDGVRLGLHVFARLYDDLLVEAERNL